MKLTNLTLQTYWIGFDCKNILIDNFLPTEPILATLIYMKELMLKKVNENEILIEKIKNLESILKIKDELLESKDEIIKNNTLLIEKLDNLTLLLTTLNLARKNH